MPQVVVEEPRDTSVARNKAHVVECKSELGCVLRGLSFVDRRVEISGLVEGKTDIATQLPAQSSDVPHGVFQTVLNVDVRGGCRRSLTLMSLNRYFRWIIFTRKVTTSASA